MYDWKLYIVRYNSHRKCLPSINICNRFCNLMQIFQLYWENNISNWHKYLLFIEIRIVYIWSVWIVQKYKEQGEQWSIEFWAIKFVIAIFTSIFESISLFQLFIRALTLFIDTRKYSWLISIRSSKQLIITNRNFFWSSNTAYVVLLRDHFLIYMALLLIQHLDHQGSSKAGGQLKR